MSPPLPWPPEHRYFASGQLPVLISCCRERFASGLLEHRLPGEMYALLETFYLPLASWLVCARQAVDRPLQVGVCGGQGTGKSTLCALLLEVLDAAFELPAASLSLDDLYKTRVERERLAADVHPLLVTRGVPGTHDVELGVQILDKLLALGPGESMAVPSFDKARDDRRPRNEWPVRSGPVEIVLLEGWCVGAVAQAPAALAEPVNQLERAEDVDASWRTYVNTALLTDYPRLFERLDLLVLLEVDSMERVLEWRRLQEHQLLARASDRGGEPRELNIMSDRELQRFVMHYERLTRHILAEMPARADAVVHLDASHNARCTTVNRAFAKEAP